MCFYTATAYAQTLAAIAKKMDIQQISDGLKEQLLKVTPSVDFTMKYRPCKVRLKDGQVIDRVFVVERDSYLMTWGVMPKDDPGKKSISIEDVEEISESPFRMPADNASVLYDYGESGMGYVLFTIKFNNGQILNCVTGNAVDFPPIPDGLTTKNIIEVIPGGQRKNTVQGLDYFWCIFKGQIPKIDKEYKQREKKRWFNKLFG
jgi:hypothetical protein